MNKKWRLWRWLAVASILCGILLAIFQPTLNGSGNMNDFEWRSILLRFSGFVPLCFFGFALLVVLLKFGRLIFRWLFTWRTLKWFLRALAALAVLVALLYVEENWRGKRAWEIYKHELEAKGEKFDFASFIPLPVPDDQNFALTPIVASGYSRVMDKDGRLIEPENTNVVNRLKMDIYRYGLNTSTNLQLGSWQKGKLTDVKAWQDYYRATAITNIYAMSEEMLMPGRRNYMAGLTNASGFVTNVEIQILAPSEFPVAAQMQSAAADVLFALSKFDSAIEELRQASQLPFSRFPLNYATNNPVQIMFPHWAALKSCALFLRLRAIAELDERQTDKALADVQLIFCLARSIRQEPIEYSFEQQMSLVNLAVQPIWEGLARRQWSAEQLAALERDMAGIDAVKDYGFGMRAGLAFNLKSLEYLRTERMANSITCMCGDTMWLPTLIYRLLPDGWFFLNERATATVFEAALPTANEAEQRIFSPKIQERIGHAEGLAHRGRIRPDNVWLSFVPPLSRMAMNSAHIQAGVDMARIACALERYHLAHGEYPESLAGLIPQFMEQIPPDVVDGQPLQYRRTNDGRFLLYSTGWNGKDDGGVFGLNDYGRVDFKKGDWVWQYPVK